MSIITYPSGLDEQVGVRFGEYGLLTTAAYASQWSGLELLFRWCLIGHRGRQRHWSSQANSEVPMVHSKNGGGNRSRGD